MRKSKSSQCRNIVRMGALWFSLCFHVFLSQNLAHIHTAQHEGNIIPPPSSRHHNVQCERARRTPSEAGPTPDDGRRTAHSMRCVSESRKDSLQTCAHET